MFNGNYIEYDMNGLGAILVAAGLMGGTSAAISHSHGTNDGSVGAPPQNPKKVIPKGCQEYTVRGIKIIALSEKRAWEKYEKSQRKK